MEEKKLKIFWLCNFMPAQIQKQENLPITPYGGWICSLLEYLIDQSGIELFITFPMCGEHGYKGEFANVRYESVRFDTTQEHGDDALEQSLKAIILKENPDVIHFFGTESMSALAITKVAACLNMLDCTIVNIQGLLYVSAPKILFGVSFKVYQKILNLNFYKRQQKNMFMRGELEKETLCKIRHVFGRTMWDRACVYDVNPQAEYHYCPEILRNDFYTGQWNINSCEKYTIVAVAEHPIKGLHFLLEAMPFVIEKFPATKIRILGGNVPTSRTIFINSYHAYIAELIKKNKLKDKITFTGQLTVQQMKREYLNANIFVLSSIIENESNTLSEAKLLGVPCIASYVGGTLNRIEHGVDGYQYPCAEPEILAYYICQMFANEEKTVQMANRARENALSLNNPQKVIDTVIRVYKELAQGEKNER